MNEATSQKPAPVRLAVVLLWSSLLLDWLAYFVGSNFVWPDALTPAFFVTFGLLSALPIFWIVQIARGRNWARTTFLVLSLIGAWPLLQEGLVAMFRRSWATGLFGAASVALEVVAICLLYTKPANAWFRNPMKQAPQPRRSAGSD